MLDAWRAGVAALRGPLVVGACIGCFVLGAITAPPTDTPRTTTTQPAAAITDQSVNRLAAALEAAQATTVPTDVTPTIAAAEDVLEAVREGAVTVVVTPATLPPVQPTLPPSTTVTATTVVTTTTAADEVLRWVTP